MSFISRAATHVYASVRNALFIVTLLALIGCVTGLAVPRHAYAQGNSPKDLAPPLVFQAAGPSAESIQSSVDQYRAALGAPNGNTADRSARVAARSTGTAAAPTRRRRLP